MRKLILLIFLLTALFLVNCGKKAARFGTGDTIAVSLNREPYVGEWVTFGNAYLNDTTIISDSTISIGVELLADGRVKCLNLHDAAYTTWSVFDDSVLVLFGSTLATPAVKLHDTVTINKGVMTFADKMKKWYRRPKPQPEVTDTASTDTLGYLTVED